MLTIPGVSDVQIAAATAGPAVIYQWPRPYVVSSFFLHERETADPIVLGRMRLRMVDDENNELVIDGQGLTNGSPLALIGIRPRWIPFRRVVRAGRRWTFQIINENAAQTVTPIFLFGLKEQ